jgi:predicted phosphodiesterase
MKLQILSDTHHFPATMYPSFVSRDILPDADVLVLAGDLGGPLRDMVAWVRGFVEAWPKLRVVLVPGNHDYYGQDWTRWDPVFREAFRSIGPNVFPLQREAARLDGILFLGATLWSAVPREDAPIVEGGIADYQYIRHAGRFLRAEDSSARFALDSAWIFDTLREHSGEKTVVVTHHLPSFACVNRKWRGSRLNSAFASALDDEIRETRPALWVHGHTHHPVDTRIGDTRVVCNPLGYARETTRRKRWKSFAVEI